MSKFGTARAPGWSGADRRAYEAEENSKREAGMGRSVLRGDFLRNHPAKRSCSRSRELHVPKIRFGRDKLHSNVLLAVASTVDGDNAAFHRLRSVVIHQDQCLSH